MSVVGIGDNLQSLLAGLDIEQLLRKKKGEEIIPETGTELLSAADSLAAEIAAEKHSVGGGSGSNPMDRNFVRQEREESRYISATLKGLRAESQMEDARQNSAAALLEACGGVNVSGTYFPNPEQHTVAWYEMQVKRKIQEKEAADRAMEEAAARKREEHAEEKEQLDALAAGEIPAEGPAATNATPLAPSAPVDLDSAAAAAVAAAAADLPAPAASAALAAADTPDAGAASQAQAVVAETVGTDFTIKKARGQASRLFYVIGSGCWNSASFVVLFVNEQLGRVQAFHLGHLQAQSGFVVNENGAGQIQRGFFRMPLGDGHRD